VRELTLTCAGVTLAAQITYQVGEETFGIPVGCRAPVEVAERHEPRLSRRQRYRFCRALGLNRGAICAQFRPPFPLM
jgi:hypothetical protein